MKKKRLSLLALTLVLCMVFAACGPAASTENTPTPSAAGSDGPEASPSEGAGDAEQVLNVSMIGAPADVNPLTATTTESAELLANMFETLVRAGENNSIEQGSGLAESWTISDDQTVYTFTLRDATWSDGSKITADQFVYAWEKGMSPDTASEYAYMYYPIKGAEAYATGESTDFSTVGVEAVDEKTLKVTLAAPTDYFLSVLVLSQFGALPVNFVEDAGSDFYLDPEHMAFNGPFILKEWLPDQSMTFEKNPSYWDAENVKLQTLKYQFILDTNTTVNLYQTGEIDVMLVQPEFLDTYKDAAGFVSVTEPVTEYLKFNLDNKYFANKKIRQAFNLALNRVSYMEDFMKTGSTPAYGYVPPSIKGTGGKDFRDNVGDLYYDAGTNDGALEEAKQMLEEGLSEVGSTFEEFNNGLSLVIGEGDLNLKTAQVFQEYWKNNLGVDVEVRSMRYALRQEAYDSGDWTIGKEGWGADYNDAQSFLELFETSSPYNDCHYSSEKFDTLMKEAKALTGEERLEKMQEAEKVLVGEDLAILPTFFQTRSFVSQDKVQGVLRNGVGLRVDYKGAYVK